MATIKDVAKHAGVSVSTVSLVLNNSSAVKHETRYQVLNSIRTLQYKRNNYARSLVTKEKKIIGVVKLVDETSGSLIMFNKVVDTYVTEMLRSIEREIEKADYSMLIDWDFCFLDENSLPLIIEGDKVDGVLLAGGFNKKMPVDRILSKNIPVVLVGSRHERFDYVDTSFELGLKMAMQHLLDYGHKNIAFINGPESSQSSRRKMDGYLQTLRENKLEFREEYISSGNFTGQDGYLGMKCIMESGVHPTALVAATDGIALGAMRYLYENDIYCPRDISIIGFEGGLLAEYSVPPLTTVNMRKEIIGEEASKILIKRLEKNKFKLIHLIIEPELNIGGSVRRI